MRVLVGLDDGNGAESAERSASAKDDADENMATPMDNVRAAYSWPGWEQQPASVTKACWGPADDGVQWENVDDAENVEPGTDPSLSLHEDDSFHDWKFYMDNESCDQHKFVNFPFLFSEERFPPDECVESQA